MIAHDLRNPVQTVLAQIYQLLRRAGRDDEVRVPVQSLRRIERGANALGRMAEALLDVARIELGRIELHPEPSNLPDAVRELLDRMQPVLAQRGHAIELSTEGRVPMVSLDCLAFEQIVTNLIENAAKFSPEGAPIRVTVRPSDAGALVSVQDRGPGISAADQQQLFDRFFQARRAREHKSGLGLGLFIVKGYVGALGGHVGVDSEPGHGSTFNVWLPTCPPAREAERTSGDAARP